MIDKFFHWLTDTTGVALANVTGYSSKVAGELPATAVASAMLHCTTFLSLYAVAGRSCSC
jgi:hypothetical protein